MSVTFLLNNLHCDGYLWTERHLHNGLTNGNWCLHDFGFCADLQPFHTFPCSPGLVGVVVEVDSVKVLLLE